MTPHPLEARSVALASPPGRAILLPLAHLCHMSDGHGLFEHALEDQPRIEHGYCTDDVARALAFVVRESALVAAGGPSAQLPDPTPGRPVPTLDGLVETYLQFLENAVQPNGAAHNRMHADGTWSDTPAGGDWWGRAIGALGVTAALAADPAVAARAANALIRAACWHTQDLHAALFAAVGAAEALSAGVQGVATASRDLIARADAMLPPLTPSLGGAGAWLWPEPRLRYGNGIMPEALLAGGAATGDPAMVDRGLAMLGFYLDVITVDGALSFPGTSGWGPNDRRPQFDQQPIEAATLAQACARAWDITGDQHWRAGVGLAWQWFLGDNDASTPMFDPATGAGFDGLTANGRNTNRGAESTLAALTTHQLAHRLGLRTGLQAATSTPRGTP